MRKSGARKRKDLAAGSRENSRPVRRNTHKGYSELAGLTGLNLTEGTNYDVEENEIFEVGAEVKKLLENLESKDERKEE